MSANEEKKNETAQNTLLFGSENKPWQQIISDLDIDSQPKVSPPEQDPCCTYDQVPGISCRDFQLSPYRTWF